MRSDGSKTASASQLYSLKVGGGDDEKSVWELAWWQNHERKLVDKSLAVIGVDNDEPEGAVKTAGDVACAFPISLREI